VIILAALLAIGFFVPACRGVKRTYTSLRYWGKHPDTREISIIVIGFYLIAWGIYGLFGIVICFYFSWILHALPDEPK